MLKKLIVTLMLLSAPMAQARVVMLACDQPVQQQVNHDCCPSKAAKAAESQLIECCDEVIDFAAESAHKDNSAAKLGNVLPPVAAVMLIGDAAAPQAGLRIKAPPPDWRAQSAHLTFQRTARRRI